MFYWASKIFSYLLSPSIWILLLCAWPLLSRDKRKMKRRGIIALALVYLLMNSFLVDEVLRWWESPMQSQASIEKPYAVAVILGGHMVTMDRQTDRRIFRSPCDRILQGFELYKQDKVKSILLSGGPSHPLHKQEYEAVWLKDFLVLAGIPLADLLVDSLSRNTHENALHSAELLKGLPQGQPVLLITSASHMRRALGCFEDAGLNVQPYSTDKIVGDRRFDIEHLLMPDLQSLIKWQLITHEIIGYISYRMVGYL